MTSIPSPPEPPASLSLKFLLLLGCYFGLHIVLRVTISDSLDYDEAEQALLGQWLLAGYTEQPPLYTWIQYFLFEIFGRNVFSVSLLKNSLLFFTYVLVFLSGKAIFKDPRRAVLATCSLLLIPQIAWESQRDMTHTTLVVFASAATLYQALRLVEKQSLIKYTFLGLFLSIGFLAKANYGLFLTVLCCTLLTLPEGRKTIFHRYTLVAFTISIIATVSYGLWMIDNQDIVFSVTHKFKRAVDNFYVLGPVSLVTTSFLFLTPLWFFYLVVFPKGYGLTDNFSPTFQEKFIARYVGFIFLILLLVVLAFKVTYVKDRWLQPLLFAAPLYFFSRNPDTRISPARFKAFVKITLAAACCIYIAFTIRVVGASYIDRFCRMNYPFGSIAEEIKKAGFEKGLIISNNRFLAGNMLFQLPGSSAIIPDYRFETIPEVQDHRATLVIWMADRSRELPKELTVFLDTAFDIDAKDYPVHFFEHRYKFGRTEKVTLAGIMVSPEFRAKSTL